MPPRKVRAHQWVMVYRQAALKKQDRKCCYCHEPLTRRTATADHVKPRSKGGRDAEDNIVASCRPCNMAKGSMSDGRFRRSIKSPRRGDRFSIWRAWMRRRINLAAGRACKRLGEVLR